MSKYVAKFDIPKPEDHLMRNHGDGHWTYLIDGEEMKWTNVRPLPELGAKIKVTQNGIGSASVVGYFYESVDGGAYVGVMTMAHNPPKWLKEQKLRSAGEANRPLWYRAGVGCTYGMECEVPAAAIRKIPAWQRTRLEDM